MVPCLITKMENNWQPPYIGSVSTQKVFGKKGVYLIRELPSKQIVYVGMSKSNLWKALYRHFQSWNDYRCRRVVYHDRDRYEVKTLVLEQGEVDRYERSLIREFLPRDNADMYEDFEDIISGMDTVLGEIKNEIPF